MLEIGEYGVRCKRTAETCSTARAVLPLRGEGPVGPPARRSAASRPQQHWSRRRQTLLHLIGTVVRRGRDPAPGSAHDTMPEDTLTAARDHAMPARTIDRDLERAHKTMRAAREAGVESKTSFSAGS
jgi:hypothetical protein